MTHPVLLRPECVAAAGDIVTGVLLSQIVYWCLPATDGRSKLTVQRDGFYWIAKTREQWVEETGLTVNQFRRAMGVLQQKRLVSTKVMKFHGVTMVHLRLLQAIAGAEPRSGDHNQSGLVMITNPYRTTYNTDREYDDPFVLASRGSRSAHLAIIPRTGKKAEGSTGSIGIKETIENVRDRTEPEQDLKQKPTPQGWMMRAADILKRQQSVDHGSLGAYWKSRMATVYGGWQKPLTGKECGQLKQLSKSLGDQTKPIIDYVVNHWGKFASRAGIAAGVSFPADPHIGFLLKYHAVAVNLLTPEVTSSPPVAAEPVQLIATGTDEETVHALTSQELTELLDGLKSP